jgi:SAM-dependent methyltransferase
MSRLATVLRALFGCPHKRRAAARMLLRRQHCERIFAVLSKIDFDFLRDKYPNAKWTKYLDLAIYVPVSVGFCDKLGLIESLPQRVLDIGCGTGLFLYCAQYFGHTGVGVDVENDLLGEMALLLGVERRIEPVRSFSPISVNGSFDLITAMGTLFDRANPKNGQRRWGCEEWHYFLCDLENHLSPSGRIFLRINRGREAQERGLYYYDENLYQSLRHGYLGDISFLFDRAGLRVAISNLSRTKEDGSVAPLLAAR